MKLYNEDCLEVMDRLIKEGVKVDAIITDPPYGTTACKWDSVIPFDEMWERLNKLIKPNGAIVLFGSEPFSSVLRMSNIKNYKYDWTWIKNRSTGGLSATKKPMACIETISVFYMEQCVYNPQKVNRTNEELKKLSKNSTCTNSKDNGIGLNNEYTQKRENLTKKFPRRDIYIKTAFNRSKEKVAHPTQKPVALMEYLIKTYTNEGETVLDFTMGSGTTGVACMNTNRNFIGIELDESYFKIAEERIEKHTTQQKLFT